MEDIYTIGKFFKDYWNFLYGRRARFVIFSVLRSAAAAVPFAIAFYLGKIIDFFTNHRTSESLEPFYVMCLTIALLGCFQVWLRFFSKVRLQTIGAEIRQEIRVNATAKMMEMELAWHEKEETGSKVQKINAGSEAVFSGFKNFSNDGIQIITGLFGGFAIFFALSWKYVVFALAYTIVYIAAERYYARILSYWQQELAKASEKSSGKLVESASNLLTVKTLGLKEYIRTAAKEAEGNWYKTWIKARNASMWRTQTVKIFGAFAYAGFIALVGLDAYSGLITVGAILAYATYFSRLKGALDDFTDNIMDYTEIKSTVGRFMTIYGREIADDRSKPEISKSWERIDFADVTFAYKDEEVLRDFSLTIRRGEKIGMVGKSGCGKSTIAKLMLGLYKPQKGKIIIEGKRVDEYRAVTARISIVLQESEMFNMSLLENITISNPEVDMVRFNEACRIAQLDALIEKMPDGIRTGIGEKGYKLSGGERQRIGIARAIYKNADIMIMDEATSNLDSKTEHKILEEIEKSLKNSTLIVIAHRLSTLRSLDRIVVVSNGRVVQDGGYVELSRKKGLFSELHRLQKK